MRATFSGFSTAQFALNTAQNSLNVVGQNIANINTVGYTKQNADQISLNLTNPDNKYNIGFGSQTQSISQSRDPYLDLRFRTEIAKVGEADVVASTLTELESIFDEIAKVGIQEGLTDLMSALQDLSLNISSDEFQEMVKGSADSLMQLINQYSNQLETVRNDATSALEDVDIPAVNDILADIATLNTSIEKAELIGSSALELRDQRNVLLDELASYMDIDIRYINTEVQPGVTVDRLQITLNQQAYDDEGKVYTNNLTLLNGSYAGSFNLVTDEDGKYGITFTSGIGDALSDSESINKLNNAMNSLANVNEYLAYLTDTITELDEEYANADTDVKRNALQTQISELANKRDDYIGMRDNFLNTIEAFINVDYTIDPTNGTVEVTFQPTQTTVYESTEVTGLATDDSIGDLQFEYDEDSGILSFNGTEIGLVDVTTDELDTLNRLMSNFSAIYEQLDSIYEDLLTLDDGADPATGLIPDAETALEAAINAIIDANEVMINAQSVYDKAFSAVDTNKTVVTTLQSEIATYEQEIATLLEVEAESGSLSTENQELLAELEAKLATAEDDLVAAQADTEALELALSVAENDLQIATEDYQAAGKARSDAQEVLDVLLKTQSDLLEERVGLFEQRDKFLSTMGLIIDMDYTFEDDPESANYGKLTSFTFTGGALDPETEPPALTLITYPDGPDGDGAYNSDTMSFYLHGSSGSIMVNQDYTGDSIDGINIQSSLTSDILLFNAGSFKGSLDTLNASGEDGSLRGITYYEKQLDELVITFAEVMNDLNTNKAAGYNVGETDANGYAYYPVVDSAGNSYYSMLDADGNPLIYVADPTALDSSIILDENGYMYTSDPTISYGGTFVSVGEPLVSIDRKFDPDNYTLGGTTNSTILGLDPKAYGVTGIPQYNDDGTPSLDELGNHIYHDEALQVDSAGNNVGNNFLFTYDPADPSGTITVAQGWVVGDYSMTTSIVPGSASGANDNILSMINALTASHTFETTTSDAPFTTGSTVSKFEGSFYDYFSNTCTTLALDIKTTNSTLENSVLLVSDIADARNAVSGVNVDEEGISLIQYQKAYTAAARLMTTLDEAIDIILNMGKVGR